MIAPLKCLPLPSLRTLGYTAWAIQPVMALAATLSIGGSGKVAVASNAAVPVTLNATPPAQLLALDSELLNQIVAALRQPLVSKVFGVALPF